MAGQRENDEVKLCAVVGCTDASNPYNLCPLHEAQVKGEVERDHELVFGGDMTDLANAFQEGFKPRPSHRTVAMWNDVRALLDIIRTLEFQLGFLPEKPATSGELDIDFDGLRCQLIDARTVLETLAVGLVDGVAE